MLDLDERFETLDDLRPPDLWAEIEARASDGRRAVRLERPPRPPRWSRRYALAAAAALLVLAGLIGALLLGRPSEASASDVIEEAQRQFAEIPSFRATIFYELSPEGANEEVPKGATAVVEISYRAPNGFRQELVEADPVPTHVGGPGSFHVWDGERSGEFRADSNEFTSFSFGRDYEPLRELSWSAPYPNWEEICRLGGSEVLADAQIAGRAARHVRCGDFRGGFWELWIDRETGLMLKVVGQVGAGDLTLGTSPQGGFEVTTIEYEPSFSPGTFTVAAPAGARDIAGEREAILARVPPLRATVSQTTGRESVAAEIPDSRGGDWVRVETLWYRDASTWRKEVREDSLPELSGLGAGSFIVQNGEEKSVYYAQENAFSVEADAEGALEAVGRLVPGLDAAYTEERCESVGSAEIAGRPARHLRCRYRTKGDPIADVWLDAETGIYLKLVTADYRLEVTSIEYEPTFEPGTFEFVPPPGAKTIEEVSNEAYRHTSLKQGELAPAWSGPLLDGGAVELESLRGKPVLVFFWADWCDKACFSSFPAFEQASKQWAGRVEFLSVDFRGSAAEAKKIMEAGGYTFAVVDDSAGNVGDAWGIESVPLWVLLDADGRVVEVRIKSQSPEQLDELAAKAAR
jgi:thiol-disulfide isomerase/thioredoxin